MVLVKRQPKLTCPNPKANPIPKHDPKPKLSGGEHNDSTLPSNQLGS